MREGEGKQFNGEERSVEENKASHPRPQQRGAEVVTHHSRRPEDLCRASSSSSEVPGSHGRGGGDDGSSRQPTALSTGNLGVLAHVVKAH